MNSKLDDCLPKRKIGVNGHLSNEETEKIIELWRQRYKTFGTVSRIANQLNVSSVTVSNVILRVTGKRPSFHNEREDNES